MATARRHFGFSDRGKKHDDRAQKGEISRLSSMLRTLVTVRKRRVVLALLGVWLLYLFIKNIPTDLPPISERIDPRYGRMRPRPPTQSQGAPTVQVTSSDAPTQQYEGPIRFFKLGGSLRSFGIEKRDNVLFALASPRSASPVLTAACAMASHNRTRVHVAVMGRKEMALSDLLALNGISQEECPILWHDAQPDFALQSSTNRMQISCEAAIGHIHRAHPIRAIFFDDTAREDDFLRRALKGRIKSLQIPHIQVPNADSWMLILGTASLRQWDKVEIDILVQVPRDAVGSLLRLLQTIRDADYRGLAFPRITLELPFDIDGFLFDYLATFQWPPGSSAANSKVVIRHRIDPKLMSPAMASARFIESFYPSRPAQSHVLVLSPDAELTSDYYQFLIYMLMEHHYGATADTLSLRMMGISLTAPPVHIGTGERSSPVLLWQYPSADATLFFGEEWVQLHQFVAHRLASDPDLSRSIDAELSLPSSWPTWQKLTMEWMQLGGLFMAHPNLEEKDSPLVTMHSELHQVPEELARQRQRERPMIDEPLKLSKDGDVLTAEGPQGGEFGRNKCSHHPR